MTAKNDGRDKRNEGKPGGTKYSPRKSLEIPARREDVDAFGRAFAESMTGGPFAALRIIRAAEKSAGYEAEIDVPGMIATLRAQGEAVNAGNLARVEAMLMNQATALQTVFARLVERGMSCTEVAPFEANLRMGLRAQSQCRATLETLAAIKNPSSVAFVRQANIAAGPQQVNNGMTAPSRAREIESQPSQLLGADHGERMDTGAAGATSGCDPALATVGTFDRAEDGRG